MRLRSSLSFAAALAATLCARPCAAQDVRVGVVFGGLGFVGAVVEKRWGDRGAELVVSTFTFHDLSVSAGGKQYFGASWLKPAVGAGLTVETSRGPDGAGTALLARFPLGGDWRVSGAHYLTWEISVMRGLAVRRPDPTDRAPLTQRIIPFPSVSYRVDPGAL